MSEVLDRLRTALADRYTIERELGRGGMAVVFLAEDLRHERQVAIKVLRPELTSAVAGARFLREIKLTANLHHPHILTLLDSGEAEGLLYYVMPYVKGESLREKLNRERRLPVDGAVSIAREVADALSYAHARGLLHRDIKPENILLESGHAVVGDFGIAKALREAAGDRLTDTGVSIGTPTYMSPEQAAGEQELDAASDLYSLGCVLYEMLAGAPPVADSSVQKIVSRKLLGEFRPLRDVRKDAPREIADAVSKALATELAERFAAVSEFAAALSTVEQAKRRIDLFRVLGLYTAASAGVLAIAYIFMVQIGLPDWFFTGAILLLLVGLPIILTTAFLQQGGPWLPGHKLVTALGQGDKGDAVVSTATSSERQAMPCLFTWRNAISGGVLALALWGVVAAGWMLFGGEYEGAAGGELPSIAVLPLENRSGLEEDAYFTEGIHDEILTQLSKIGGLSVRGRTSVMAYRDSPKNLRQIGEELNARYLLEGGVQRAGETVSINVQLMDSETDDHVLADTYDRQFTVDNLLSVQREVALRIAEALHAALTVQEREQIGKAPTDDTEAYDFYLRGKEYARRRGSENRKIAEEMYVQAIELDPEFALAYSALSRHYEGAYFQGRDRTQENADRIKDAAYKAVKLDPDLSEAHIALANYYSTVLDDQGRALQEYSVAQRLNPNCCFEFIGFNHIIRGEWEEGIANFRKAVALDPRNTFLVASLGAWLVYTRNYDEAIPVLDTYIALEPDGGLVWMKALAYFNQPDGAEKALQVLTELEKARGGASPGYNMSDGSVWWKNRIFFRILHDHYRERAREPIPSSATDSSGYFLAKAVSHDLDGETAQARAYYDSARVAYEARIKESGEESLPPRVLSALAISYAGLGRAEDAIREATRAVELTPPGNAAATGQGHIRTLAEVYVMVGEYDAAIDRLEYLMSVNCPLSVPQFRADPIWYPLRDHPRFQALLEK